MIVVGALCLWEFGVKGGRRYLVVLAGLMGVAVLLLGGGVLRERFEAMLGSNVASKDVASAAASAEVRRENFVHSVVVTVQHPLFGVGPGDFQVIDGGWHVSHNVFTQLSSEAGLPALVLFLMIFTRAFALVRRARQLAGDQPELLLIAAAVQADLWGFAVASFFFPAAYHFFSYFLVTYAIVCHQIAATPPAQSETSVAVREPGPPQKAYQKVPKPREVWGA